MVIASGQRPFWGLLENSLRLWKYIARSEAELENSGTSVNAKQIPNTGFWIVTNNATNNKKELLKQALTLLGYEFETIRSLPDTLR